MCGIAGVLYSDPFRTPDPDVLKKMADAIAHRGPDGEGFFRAGNVGLVHRRLAIIDLAGGQQPISNEDDSLQVVFNGEIYNYQELRIGLERKGHHFRTNSDTEVLVHLYEEHGPDMCRLLRGMFAFALWNVKTRQLLLARDHVGQKPLYVYRDSQKLVFGSELKALLAHPDIRRELNPAAVEDYLTFGFVPGRASIFGHVQKLPAGHWQLVSADQLDTAPQRYWQLSFESPHSRPIADWKDCVNESLRDSVRAHLIADVPVGAFLSGGLDSSCIVATASELRSDPLQTFSIGFHESEYNELPHAASVARKFGCQHVEEVVTAEVIGDLDDLVFLYDEPFADTSAISTIAVSRVAARHVRVALSGDGGDELFAGYRRYTHDLKEAGLRELLPNWLRSSLLRRMAAVWPKLDWLPRPLRIQTLLQNLSTEPEVAYANTVSICRAHLRQQLLNPDFMMEHADHRPEQIVESAFLSGKRDVLSGMLAADTGVLLPDDFLTKVDRASMGFGLEVRPPLIDWQLMELAASMPSDLKIRHGSGKWLLKEIFEPRLPDRLVHRRKQGFELPIDEWLRGPLKDQFHQTVLSPDSGLAAFINVPFAAQLYRAHCSGRGRYGQVLWSLLVLGRWLKAWGSSGLPERPLAIQKRESRLSRQVHV